MKKPALLFLNKLPQMHLLGSILVILLYLFMFLVPALKRFFVLQHQASGMKTEIRALERDWANLDSIQGNILRLRNKLAYYQKRLPSEKELSQVLGYLSDSARKLDVRITEIKPVAQTQDAGEIYYGVPILLKAECGYHQLGRFLNELELAQRYMKISDLKIEPSRKPGRSLSIHLMIVTYVIT